MAEVTVITEALHAEANKWRTLSDLLRPAKTAVDGLTLGTFAFFVGDLNAGSHAKVYEEYRQYMARLLSQGQVEFDQLGQALDKTADEYDEADEIAELNLNDVYTI